MVLIVPYAISPQSNFLAQGKMFKGFLQAILGSPAFIVFDYLLKTTNAGDPVEGGRGWTETNIPPVQLPGARQDVQGLPAGHPRF